MLMSNIAFLAVGLIMSAPYSLLTGASLNDFIVIVIIAPFASFSLYIFLMEKRSNPDLKPFFRPIMISLLLPIALNGFSAVLRFLGYAEAGNLLFTYRYYSFWLVLAGIIYVGIKKPKKSLP